jgi:hypothetical protein
MDQVHQAMHEVFAAIRSYLGREDVALRFVRLKRYHASAPALLKVLATIHSITIAITYVTPKLR